MERRLVYDSDAVQAGHCPTCGKRLDRCTCVQPRSARPPRPEPIGRPIEDIAASLRRIQYWLDTYADPRPIPGKATKLTAAGTAYEITLPADKVPTVPCQDHGGGQMQLVQKLQDAGQKAAALPNKFLQSFRKFFGGGR